MEKISIVRRRLDVAPTRAEMRAKQRLENPATAATALADPPSDHRSPEDAVSVDLGPQVMDELWSGGHLGESASGARHFIVEAEKSHEENRVVLKLQFMKPDYYLRLLTTEEVCEMLHVSRSTLYGYAHDETLKTYRMGRSLRYRFQDVLEFLTGCQAGSH